MPNNEIVPPRSLRTEALPSSARDALSHPLPSKEELEREQLRLTNQKLKREVEPEKWWLKLARNLVAIGGVVTVAATAYGIWDSYNKTIADREHTRTADQRARFEDAIKRLESSSTISKLVGVSVPHIPAVDDNHRFQFMLGRDEILAKVITSVVLPPRN
jgi:hypothetical protein